MNKKQSKKIKINTIKISRKNSKILKVTKLKTLKVKTLKVKKLKVKNDKNINSKKKVNEDELDNIYNGGEAFARGGFGCLFKPALKCQNKENPPNYVSKLSLKNDSEREYNYISSIKKRLESLPENIKSYLLLYNITICAPKPLSDADKLNMDTICEKNFKRITDKSTNTHITSQTINNNIDRFRIINMPQLGMDVSSYIAKTKLSYDDIIKLNNIIIEYINVVIPNLYKKGVVHGDVKSDNMMFKLTDVNMPVLIDWGLSYIVDENSKKAPNAIYDLATQWHHPFSSFLFKRKLVDKYDNFLKKLKADGLELTRDTVLPFALSCYSNFMNQHSNQFMALYNLFSKFYMEEFATYLENSEIISSEYLIMYNIALNYIVQYIIDVLLSYTINNKLDLDKYFNEVYLINVDTWGILSLYYDIVEKKKEMFSLSDKEHKMLIDKIMYMMIDNIFKNGNKKIDLTKVTNDITKINNYLISIKK